jgi:hypothetical protein
VVGLMQSNYQGTTMSKTTQDYKGNFYDDVTKKLYKWSEFMKLLRKRNEGEKKDGAKK